MSFQIGSKYEETKARLKREIIQGTARVIEVTNSSFIKKHGAQCYFCQENIKDNALLILDQQENNLFMAPIDKRCFFEAKFRLHYN